MLYAMQCPLSVDRMSWPLYSIPRTGFDKVIPEKRSRAALSDWLQHRFLFFCQILYSVQYALIHATGKRAKVSRQPPPPPGASMSANEVAASVFAHARLVSPFLSVDERTWRERTVLGTEKRKASADRRGAIPSMKSIMTQARRRHALQRQSCCQSEQGSRKRSVTPCAPRNAASSLKRSPKPHTQPPHGV